MDSRAGATPSRRDLLRFGGAGLAVTSLVGCDLSTEPTGSGGGGAEVDTDVKEAPELARMVEKGDLPKLAERLPKTPMVLDNAEPGRYGGEMRLMSIGTGIDINATIGNENLLRYKPGATALTHDEVIPNIASEMTIGADGAEYTFTLREGMKWSDGQPFSADDIVFWYEDVVMNEELSPVFPDWLNVGGETPLVVEKLGDYEVVFRFAEPNGLFTINMASQRGTGITGFPAHYMRQFHKEHADDIEQLVKDSDRDNWIDFFFAKANRTENSDLPVIDAWQLTAPVGSGSHRPVAKRNPYYWKTDSDGRQLPYADRVAYDLVEEEEAAVLKASNGEYHIVDRTIVTLRNKPVFARSRDKGNYDFFETIPQNMNQMVLMLNLMHKDLVLREIFNQRDFRVALSHAINRQEIIDTVYQRQGEPWQAAPRPESPYHNETLAKQYTEYDPDKANALLDRILPDKDAEGIRLRPDGKPLFFQVDAPDHEPDFVDALEMIRPRWREVGVNMTVKNEDTDLFFTRMDANAHDAAVWEGAGGLGAPMDPFYWVPHNFNTRYGMPWYFWVTNPEDERAQEPPPETLAQIELYREMLTTGDQEEQLRLMQQIMDNAIDLFYCMGIALRMREYGLVSNEIHNTPKLSVTGWLHGYLTPSNPEQYFLTGN